jgi:Mce-associated membrane protein
MSPADRPSDDDPLTEIDDPDREIDDADREIDVADDEIDDLEVENRDLEVESGEKAEPRWPTMLLAGATALAVAAGAVAVWFGVKWFNADNDDSLAYSKVRDDVTRVATTAVITLNTLDYRRVDEDLRNWADATTGTLHDEITSIDDATKKTATDSKSVGSAKVHSLAVRELDERAGKAIVIAAVQLDVTVEGEEPVAKYQRLEATMTRVDGEWKLESIGQVPFTPGQ